MPKMQVKGHLPQILAAVAWRRVRWSSARATRAWR